VRHYKRYEGRFSASIADNDYQMKYCIMAEICQPTTSGRKDPYGQKERENKKNPTLGVMAVSVVLTLN
jgi:hypothetical protein